MLVRMTFYSLGPLLVLLAVFLSYVAGSEIYYGYASKNWPQVKGVVIESVVENTRTTNDRASYRPNITYEYRVSGAKYQSDRIAYHALGGADRSASRLYVQRYPVDSVVLIHLNPDSADVSVLEPGFGWRSFALFGVSLVLYGMVACSGKSETILWR